MPEKRSDVEMEARPAVGGASAPTDMKIISRVLQGKKEEFRFLVREHQDKVYAMILRQVGDPEIAKELTQEVFLRAYKHLSQFRHEANFSTWLIRIALNQTNSYFSSRRYKEAKQSTSIDAVELGSLQTEAPQDRLLDIKRLRTIISELKPMYREIMVLCCFEEKSYEDAADILGIPVGTVRSRLNKARLLCKNAFAGA